MKRPSERCRITKVRPLPVINGHDLVGILTQADIARNYPEDRVGNSSSSSRFTRPAEKFALLDPVSYGVWLKAGRDPGLGLLVLRHAIFTFGIIWFVFNLAGETG